MSRIKDNEWLNEYEDFLNAENAEIPLQIKNQVFNKIQKLMVSNALIVFFKILGIHMGVGFLSLSVCHQFGMNPFDTEKSLADWMMSVGGHHFCMFGCGVLFVSVSLFAAGCFLTMEEVNALKRTEFLQTLSLGIISLGSFAFFGVDFAISIALIWLMGSLVGGFVATEAVWKLKMLKQQSK